MFNKYWIWACITLFFISSCSKDEVVNTPQEHQTVLVSAEIDAIETGSRASIGIDGKGHFDENDHISLVYNKQQTDLTLSNGTWLPSLNWEEIGESAVFSAFYPAITDAQQAFMHTVYTDQQNNDHYEKSDLLYAATGTINKGQPVNLNFHHLMSCLTVHLKSNVFSVEQLGKAIIKVKAYNQITVNSDGSLGTVYDYDAGNKDNMPEITFKHKEGTTFQAIVCPQQTDKYSYSVWWLSITIDGRTFNVANPPASLSNGQKFDYYKSGKNVTLTYSFNEKVKNKATWLSGLQNIPEPYAEGWQYQVFNDTLKVYHLPWNSTYGWYDCNKKDPAGPNYSDQNLCWAATSSNMIHWWLDQNKENVEKYCQLNNVTIPQAYNHKNLDSEVFQAFKNAFEDRGGFMHQGFNWFFTGEYVKNQDDMAKLEISNSGGYFKDVFQDIKSLSSVVGIHSLSDLTNALQGAISNKQAVGFTIVMNGFGSGHAMTIWGAKFDDKGTVTHIYYVDNNDEPITEKNNVGLIAAKIGIYEGKDPALEGTICMENSQGKTSIPITEVTLLKLGTEEWNAYFKSHPGN